MVRFRKSKKIGPFRITASKSGLGVSAGAGPVRISRGADGKTRRTVRVPGAGFYDTEVVGDKGTAAADERKAAADRRSAERQAVRADTLADKAQGTADKRNAAPPESRQPQVSPSLPTREPTPLPHLAGYGTAVEFDGETLRVTPKNQIVAAHLGGKKGKALTLEPRDIANVNFAKATRLGNGSVTVDEASCRRAGRW